jgi:hypothetical protein
MKQLLSTGIVEHGVWSSSCYVSRVVLTSLYFLASCFEVSMCTIHMMFLLRNDSNF